MDFKKQKSIYQQIADQLCDRIVAGEWKPDERMVSVRDVATELQVNTNTVLRSFDYLQQQGIIYNRRGIGYFLATDAPMKVKALQRKQFFEEDLVPILQKMRLLGITFEEIKKELNQ
ncbi:MAG: GntR family transcriptional regulator [Bacteroidales bacterium]|nr:GntR family transcriptional regulator [Bacteroidales bacterium]